jgi:hypothetical protein
MTSSGSEAVQQHCQHSLTVFSRYNGREKDRRRYGSKWRLRSYGDRAMNGWRSAGCDGRTGRQRSDQLFSAFPFPPPLLSSRCAHSIGHTARCCECCGSGLLARIGVAGKDSRSVSRGGYSPLPSPLSLLLLLLLLPLRLLAVISSSFSAQLIVAILTPSQSIVDLVQQLPELLLMLARVAGCGGCGGRPTQTAHPLVGSLA